MVLFWQNRTMKLKGFVVFGALLTVFVVFPAGGQSVSVGKDREYRQMLQELNKRYEGFFVHEQKQKRWDAKRKMGVSKAKEKRRKYSSERERNRKNFVRVPPRNMEPLRLKWEANQQKAREKRERFRMEFAKKRAEINKVRQSARKIPEKKEVGLED